MAPIHVCILYDKPTPEFYAGELLSGNVVVSLDKPIQINDIYIKVKGKGEVKFTRSEGSGDNKKIVTYYNKEVYIDHKAMIFQTSNAETFGSGQNRFPFSVLLPATLPETFHVNAGEVKYKCKAVVKCGERVGFLSSVCKESTHFTVHALAPIPSYLLELQRSQDVKNLPFCCDACCCFSSGKVSCVTTINKGGFVPGETISYNAQMSNKTTQNLESIVLTVKQTVVCISSQGKRETTHNEFNKVACTQALQAGADFTWPVSLTLPNSMPPTNLGTCGIISVTYELEADVGEQSGCCAPDVHFRIPFMVGSDAPSILAPCAPTNMMTTAQRPNVYAGFPQPLEPGYPPAPGGYVPPAPGGYVPPAPGGYPPPQPGIPPSQPYQPGFPLSQPYQPYQPGFPPSQPYQPGFPPSQSQQTGYSPSQPYQPGFSPSKSMQPNYPPYQPGYPQSPNVQTQYPLSQPQMDGFAPSCPTVITDEPAGIKQFSPTDNPKM